MGLFPGIGSPPPAVVIHTVVGFLFGTRFVLERGIRIVLEHGRLGLFCGACSVWLFFLDSVKQNLFCSCGSLTDGSFRFFSDVRFLCVFLYLGRVCSFEWCFFSLVFFCSSDVRFL